MDIERVKEIINKRKNEHPDPYARMLYSELKGEIEQVAAPEPEPTTERERYWQERAEYFEGRLAKYLEEQANPYNDVDERFEIVHRRITVLEQQLKKQEDDQLDAVQEGS